jgi:putative transposase
LAFGEAFVAAGAHGLVTRSLDPTGTGHARWTMRWKPALNAFAITFNDRFPAAEAY